MDNGALFQSMTAMAFLLSCCGGISAEKPYKLLTSHDASSVTISVGKQTQLKYQHHR